MERLLSAADLAQIRSQFSQIHRDILEDARSLPLSVVETIPLDQRDRVLREHSAQLEAQQSQASRDTQQQASRQDHSHHDDATTKTFFKHTSARRVNTDALITASLKKQYPNLEIVVTPAGNCNLLGFANGGNASYEAIEEKAGTLPESLQWDIYIPPSRRLDGALGGLGEQTLFGKYLYKWQNSDFIVYLVDGRDGTAGYPTVVNYYILSPDKRKTQQLILEAGRWNADLHEEVWVFDGGYWQKSRELYESVKSATWDSVILSAEMKESIIDDHLSFFSARETYSHLKVPWKRGIIYYGPPGNGKTISIKAMMNTLYNHQPVPIPTLYVRTLFSVGAISVVSDIA